jgi:phosphoribosylformylglycinamidine synthase
MGKLLLEACLELFGADVLEGIQDMGAAGLTSSSVEMASRAQNGIELDLDLVPRRAKRMTPYEILLSESQERMLLVAHRGLEQRVIDICKKWELDAAVIGRVTDTKRWVVKATAGYDPLADEAAGRDPVIVCDLPIDALTDEAPIYDRPRAADPSLRERTAVNLMAMAAPEPDWRSEILRMCGSPNLGSRRWVWEKYDYIVRGGTVVRPGSDAAVVRVPCERDGLVLEKYLAFACSCNARVCELDPWAGGALAVVESCRNVVCAGAEPIGLTDCLNFGNPERPEIMEQLARAIDGIADACRALGVPVVSGNVSLYNDTDGRAILPTPTIAAVGLFASPEDRVTQWFKREGDTVLLLGEPASSLGGGEWLAQRTGRGAVGEAPRVDLEREARLSLLVLDLAQRHLLASAHDVSDGGLAVALAECCTTTPDAGADVGATIDLGPLGDAPAPHVATCLFGEHPGSVIVSARATDVKAICARAREQNVAVSELGATGGDTLSIALPNGPRLPEDSKRPTDARVPERPTTRRGAEPQRIELNLVELRRVREACLDNIVAL